MFEYKVFRMHIPRTTPVHMQDLGADGWELVTVVAHDDQFYMFFKRLKTPPKEGG